jgi:hypothetical protein
MEEGLLHRSGRGFQRELAGGEISGGGKAVKVLVRLKEGPGGLS